VEQDLREYYRTLLSKRTDSWAVEGQTKMQELEARAARSGLSSTGVGLAGLLNVYVEWNLRKPPLGMLECFEEACAALSIVPTEDDYDEIQEEGQRLIDARAATVRQFARDRLAKRIDSIPWVSMAEQTASRVSGEFKREITLRRLAARSRHGGPPATSNRVFVVRGHDHETRDEVGAFLMTIELDPIILSDEPAKGRTLIEKLEQDGNVSFAVVLLTDDDLGAEKTCADNLQPRARQNVILELGYFVGRHGRAKVVPLYASGVEVPTDYHGVQYIPLSSDWKPRLIAELKAAGLPLKLGSTD
jgi:predicted nucleotide-binding protein